MKRIAFTGALGVLAILAVTALGQYVLTAYNLSGWAAVPVAAGIAATTIAASRAVRRAGERARTAIRDAAAHERETAR